jgi:regulator of sigma D
MDLDTGSQKFYVMEDVKKGTIIAYLIKKDDLNINNPVARILIKPYVSGDGEEIALFRDKEVDEFKGEPVKGFKETIDAWLEKNQKLSKTKYYQLQGLYKDGKCEYNPDAPVKAILNDFVKGTFEVDGNTISVNGNVNLRRKPKVFKKITKNYKFGYVSGNFNCSNNNLTSLEGAPEEVGGYFICEYNKLTSLEGAPEKVGGSFMCSRNGLTSLEGAPEEVVSGFICDDNNLTSLKGAPEKVGGSFICYRNGLTSLEGAPEKVGGEFDCRFNQLTSLEGAPEKVGGDFYCRFNQLTSLEGAPEKVGGDFYCGKNKKDFTKEDVKAVSDVEGEIKV